MIVRLNNFQDRAPEILSSGLGGVATIGAIVGVAVGLVVVLVVFSGFCGLGEGWRGEVVRGKKREKREEKKKRRKEKKKRSGK